MKNQQFIDISFGGFDGFSAKDYSIKLGVGKYNQKAKAQGFEFTYAHKCVETMDLQNNPSPFQIPIEQLILCYKRDFSMYKNYNNTLIFSFFAAANGGYESINHNKAFVQDYILVPKSDYLLGIGFGPNLEFNNIHIGLTNNLNFISQYQRFSVFPYLKYRFHL
jgi:Conjugative transposon protein TraO